MCVCNYSWQDQLQIMDSVDPLPSFCAGASSSSRARWTRTTDGCSRILQLSGPPLESTCWSWRPKCTRKRLARSFSRPFSTAPSAATAFSDQFDHFDRICLRGPGGSRSKTPAEKHCFRPKSQRVNCCCCLRLRFPTWAMQGDRTCG